MQKNQNVTELVSRLKELSRTQNAPVWRRIALELEGPTRARRVVNISKISRFAKEGELIVVPGKLLGNGDLDKKVDIAAYSFSASAKEKLAQNKCAALTIEELMTKNPKGAKVRIMG